MKLIRKYIIGALILICAGLSLYYVSLGIKSSDIYKITIALGFIFLFAIFNSILSSAGNFYVLAVVHILVALLLFFFFNGIGINRITNTLIAFIYLMLQLYGYFLICYFEKERLKINWLGIFKTSWRCASWFLVFSVAVIFATQFSADFIESQIMKNLLQKLESAFPQLNLPVQNSEIMNFINPQFSPEQIEQVRQSKEFVQLPQLFKNIPGFSGLDLNNSSGKQLNVDFYNLLSKDKKSIADISVIYLKNFWNGLSDNMKIVARMILAVFVITTIQPLFWLLGIFLSIIALPIFKLLEKLKFYEKATEQAEKEKIIV
jgi:hypothetical protein